MSNTWRRNPGVSIDAGLTELRQAIGIDKKNPWVRISLGRFYAETGRPDQAITELWAKEAESRLDAYEKGKLTCYSKTKSL